MKTELTKKELSEQYGVSTDGARGGCSITLNCSWGSVSCSSDTGNCREHYSQIDLEGGGTIHQVTSISCDNRTYSCKTT